jgi:hypothetical protein
MSDQLNPVMADAAATLQNALTEKFGKQTVDSMVAAVGRVGVPAQTLQQIVTSPTAVNDFTTLSQEALLHTMQAGSPRDGDYRAAESAYAAIRAEQKAEWRSNRGR